MLTAFPFSKHCEGRITRFLFSLLFHDILFHPSVPGAFETAYQIAPLDLVHDTFYSSRKGLIDARLDELLLPGRALEIIAMRDNELRGDNVFFVGGRWDAFEREDIMEIVKVSWRVSVGVCGLMPGLVPAGTSHS
jgi:Fanconi-associated nuclease 1